MSRCFFALFFAFFFALSFAGTETLWGQTVDEITGQSQLSDKSESNTPVWDAKSQLTPEQIFASGEFGAQGFSAQWSSVGHSFCKTIPTKDACGGVDLIEEDPLTGNIQTILTASQLCPPEKFSNKSNPQSIHSNQSSQTVHSNQPSQTSVSDQNIQVNPPDTPNKRAVPLSVESYSFSQDRSLVLIYTNSRRVWRYNTRGDYWIFDRTTQKLHQLGKDREPSSLQFAKISADGKFVAYVSQKKLYLEDWRTGAWILLSDRVPFARKWADESVSGYKLSFPKASETVADLDGNPLSNEELDDWIFGTFDWVYEEEFVIQDGFRWSPDGKSIAFWAFDVSPEPNFTMIDNTSARYPKTTVFKYPKVGCQNAVVRIGTAVLSDDFRLEPVSPDTSEGKIVQGNKQLSYIELPPVDQPLESVRWQGNLDNNPENEKTVGGSDDYYIPLIEWAPNVQNSVQNSVRNFVQNAAENSVQNAVENLAENAAEKNLTIPGSTTQSSENRLLIQRLNRRQNTLELFLVNVAPNNNADSEQTGSKLGKIGGKAVRLLGTETDSAWLDVYEIKWINPETGTFLWTSEKDGYRRLYQTSLDDFSAQIPVSPEKTDVIEFLTFDFNRLNASDKLGNSDNSNLLNRSDRLTENNSNCLTAENTRLKNPVGFYFYASPENATQRYLYRADLPEKNLRENLSFEKIITVNKLKSDTKLAEKETAATETELTETETTSLQQGVHSWIFSADSRLAIHSWSSFGVPGTTELVEFTPANQESTENEMSEETDISGENNFSHSEKTANQTTNQTANQVSNQTENQAANQAANQITKQTEKTSDIQINVLKTYTDNTLLKQKLSGLALGKTELFRIDAKNAETGEAVQMDAFLIYPPSFDVSGKTKYPLMIYVYGEPAGQTVLDSWGGATYLWHQLLAQQGALVVSFDSRGTPAPKGRDWRKSIYRQMGVIESSDQAGALQALLNHPVYGRLIDAKRVGIWGWSGGGTSTLNAMFRYPELYSVGISVAPVPDYRYYDTIYQERYMGLDERDYQKSSPISFASQLQGDLLIVHGTGDDNCHYQTTECLINELIKNGKQFRMMSYPNRSHGIFEGAGTSLHLRNMMLRFLQEKLF